MKYPFGVGSQHLATVKVMGLKLIIHNYTHTMNNLIMVIYSLNTFIISFISTYLIPPT